MNLQCPDFLFLQPRFIFRENAHDNIHSFGEQGLRIYFVRIKDTLISMHRAPFGGFVSEFSFDVPQVENLVNTVETWAKQNDIGSIVIRLFPDIYAPDCAKVVRTGLLNSGFIVQHEDVSQVLPVMEHGLHADVHKKRRIRQAVDADYHFELLPPDHLEEAYSLIVESRLDKGYPVTMTLNELKETISQFSNDYLLFGVSDDSKLAATSVSIKVNDKILYTFYLGDRLEYRRHSPVTFLVAAIYDYCVGHGFQLLDLGTSTDKGVINQGLYNFKNTFGAIDSFKPTFIKHL